MTLDRDTFLAKVGTPAAYLAEAEDLKVRSQSLWETIRDEFFTKAGKPRKAEASWDAHRTRDCVDEMRGIETRAREKAYWAGRMLQDPWSHTRPTWLQKYGFLTVESHGGVAVGPAPIEGSGVVAS